jgi:Protein of unknown function (DUF3024)
VSLPTLVRKQVERELGEYCDKRVPALARHQVRLEYEIRGNSVTIVERRVPWQPVSSNEPWTRFPIAQFRFDVTRRRWTLYWRDRNLRWHRYDFLRPSPSLSDLLAEVQRDPTATFWG